MHAAFTQALGFSENFIVFYIRGQGIGSEPWFGNGLWFTGWQPPSQSIVFEDATLSSKSCIPRVYLPSKPRWAILGILAARSEVGDSHVRRLKPRTVMMTCEAQLWWQPVPPCHWHVSVVTLVLQVVAVAPPPALTSGATVMPNTSEILPWNSTPTFPPAVHEVVLHVSASCFIWPICWLHMLAGVAESLGQLIWPKGLYHGPAELM